MPRLTQFGRDSARRDVFVSHASEDKEAIARPLAEALQERGYSVWFDEYELHVGQSLRRRINQGLRESRAGVVILSRSFFRKQWTQWELDGLTARQMAGEEHAVLPVWHGVDLADVLAYSPPLADLMAARSDDGIESLADAIAGVLSADSGRGATQGHVDALPPSTVQASSGLQLTVGALNLSDGATSYEDLVRARTDDVLQIQALLWNRSAERSLRDLSARLVLPEHAARLHPVTVTAAADGESVEGRATVTASVDRAQLDFVPKSIVWRHRERVESSIYRDEHLDDGSMTGVPPSLGDLAPEETASVTWQVRVIARVVSVRVEIKAQQGWATEGLALPGRTYPCRVLVRNEGNALLRRATVECVAPLPMSMGSTSARLQRQAHDASRPTMESVSGSVTRDGDGVLFAVGNLSVGETASIDCPVIIDPAFSGDQTLRPVATVRAAGVQPIYNTAVLRPGAG